MSVVPVPAPAPVPRPRLLIASVTYVVEENRKKLAALAAEGFDLVCATPESVQSFGLTAKVHEQPAPTGYRLVALPTFGNVPSGTRFGLRGLGRLVRETRPDIVLAEAEPWALLRWQLWWAHRRHCPRALFGEFTWENLRRTGWKGRVLDRVYRAAVRTGDFAVAGNQEAGDLLRDAGLHPNRLLIAPQMGVDEALFTPPDSTGERRAARRGAGLPPDAFLVGFCGRLEAMKGVPELVAAVERLRATDADDSARDVHLALLGAGSLRPGLPTEDWLHVLPPRAHAEVGGFLRLLDVCVLPSREWHAGGTVWKEQFGHVLIEAMACGVPCVGSDSGAIPEVIGDPEHVFPEGDVGALTARLRRLCSDPADGGAARARAGAGQRARALALFTNAAVARTWGRFLRRRLTAERRSVLWVDPNLTLSSPSTKHLLHSAPALLAEGWELRAWCFGPTPDLPGEVEVHRLRPLPLLRGPLSLWNFYLAAHFHGWFANVLRGRPPAGIVHTMGGLYLGADISSTHFVNAVWLRRQWELGLRGLRQGAAAALTVGGALMDAGQFRNRRCRLFLPVSDSIAAEVRARCHPGAEVVVLPNSYDETRFNPTVRARWREPMRAELGYGAEDFVFVFVSQGHHRRKGFWLAVEALHRVRSTSASARGERRPVRFLAVGGRPDTLAGLRTELDAAAPDWRDWVQLAGMQPEVERYLAAADAFLFPSYFEAFCLAEIEAGALGLPLLLTPHHGSEMVLRDGVNGRFLSFEPPVMAAQLEAFLREPTSGVGPAPLLSGAVTRGDYARRLADLYQRRADAAEARVNSSAAGTRSSVDTSSSQAAPPSGDSGSPGPCTTV